eukprot:jgi/Mesen1/2457/ME000158S01651
MFPRGLLCYVACVLFLVQATGEVLTSTCCSGKANGMHADSMAPASGKFYCSCAEGALAFYFQCEDGHVFSELASKCVPASCTDCTSPDGNAGILRDKTSSDLLKQGTVTSLPRSRVLEEIGEQTSPVIGGHHPPGSDELHCHARPSYYILDMLQCLYLLRQVTEPSMQAITSTQGTMLQPLEITHQALEGILIRGTILARVIIQARATILGEGITPAKDITLGKDTTLLELDTIPLVLLLHLHRSSYFYCSVGELLGEYKCPAGQLFSNSEEACVAADELTCIVAESPTPTVNRTFGLGAPNPNNVFKFKNRFFRYQSIQSVPNSVDWRQVPGVVLPPEDQQDCAACYSFVSSGAVEAITVLRGGGAVESLSKEQLLDCNVYSQGCLGGYPTDTLEYISSAGGVTSEAVYPYLHGTDPDILACDAAAAKNVKASISGYEEVPILNVTALLRAVSQQPVIVNIAASADSFLVYNGVNLFLTFL